jgi:hypothetical protein
LIDPRFVFCVPGAISVFEVRFGMGESRLPGQMPRRLP